MFTEGAPNIHTCIFFQVLHLLSTNLLPCTQTTLVKDKHDCTVFDKKTTAVGVIGMKHYFYECKRVCHNTWVNAFSCLLLYFC